MRNKFSHVFKLSKIVTACIFRKHVLPLALIGISKNKKGVSEVSCCSFVYVLDASFAWDGTGPGCGTAQVEHRLRKTFGARGHQCCCKSAALAEKAVPPDPKQPHKVFFGFASYIWRLASYCMNLSSCQRKCIHSLNIATPKHRGKCSV